MKDKMLQDTPDIKDEDQFDKEEEMEGNRQRDNI